jgi:hypothetical protein
LSQVGKVQDVVVRCTGTAVVLLKKDAVLTESELNRLLKESGHGVANLKEAPPAGGPRPGEPIPAEVLPTLAGLRGSKGTLVVFTSSECPTAKDTEVRLAVLKTEYESKGFRVLTGNPNDPTAPPASLAKALGAQTTPEAFLFDAEGKLVYRGAVDEGGEKPARLYLRDALEAVLAGKPVAVPRTLGNGCEIKTGPGSSGVATKVG